MTDSPVLRPLTIRDLPAVRVTLGAEHWDFVLCRPRGNGARAVRLEHGSRAVPRTYERARRAAVDYLPRAAVAAERCAAGEASDEDRVLLARRVGSRMLGPDEQQECPKHEGERQTYRWTWDVPEDGDHASAIECASDVDLVLDCPRCIEEEEDEAA